MTGDQHRQLEFPSRLLPLLPGVFKIRTMARIVFQLRVVAGTPNSLSTRPRYPIVFIWRRYTPNTNRSFDAITRTSHSPSGGNVTGRTARRPPALDRMLTNRTTSGPAGTLPKGLSVSKRIRSRPSQSTTSAWNGNFRSNAARNLVREPGFRTTNVPAAPILTTS
jgi:hypothetical protein